jgi:integrase
MAKNVKLAKNVVVQNGRLFFDKQHKGERYTGAFELVDSNANRKTAKLIAEQINSTMKLGTFNANDYPVLKKHHRKRARGKAPLFKDYVDIWLDKKSTRAKSTQRNYAALINAHLTPYFGQMPVDEINKLEIEKWQAHAARTISASYANECLRRLKSMMRDAADDYDFTVRLDRITPIKNYEVGENTKDEIYTLEEASKLYFVMGTRLRVMMLCSMFAGLRTGEVIALKRENVDFDKGMLHVRANMSEGERVTVKTRAGVRDIKMHPVLKKYLAEHLASHNHEFVFISQRGNPFSKRQNFYDEYNRTKTLAKVRPLRWTAFRKLFASMRYACTDAVPAQIAHDMGHTDIALGLNTYSEAMDHLGCKFDDIEFPIDPQKLTKPTNNKHNEPAKDKAHATTTQDPNSASARLISVSKGGTPYTD